MTSNLLENEYIKDLFEEKNFENNLPFTYIINL